MKNNVNLDQAKVISGLDSVVIVKYIAGIAGGRTLDLSAWEDETVAAGTVIVRSADGVYKPLAIADGKYAAREADATYAGVLYRTVGKKDPEAAIMFEGVVNRTLLPAPLPADLGLPVFQTEDETA